MSATNTAFTPNPDLVAQSSGSGNNIAGTVAIPYAATIALEKYLLGSRFFTIALTGALTLTTAFVANAGAHLILQLGSDGTGRTTTFSTGFRSTGTLAGTASDIFLIQFISDGTTWNELSRSVGAIT